jgi:hypothetical protein
MDGVEDHDHATMGCADLPVEAIVRNQRQAEPSTSGSPVGHFRYARQALVSVRPAGGLIPGLRAEA